MADASRVISLLAPSCIGETNTFFRAGDALAMNRRCNANDAPSLLYTVKSENWRSCHASRAADWTLREAIVSLACAADHSSSRFRFRSHNEATETHSIFSASRGAKN